MKYGGYAGKILRIDLSKEKSSAEETYKYVKDYLGGAIINARILWEELPRGIDALDPSNPLIFGCGPLVGTLAPSSGRMSITSKSPQKNSYGMSSIGGMFGPELKYAGYDHIVVKGRAEKPVLISIQDDSVEFKDATDLWGKNTFDTEDMIRHDLGDPETRIVCIGQAGENRVKFASIRSEVKNSASRTGLGTVMGSKRLKAIAVRGSGGVTAAKPEEFFDLAYKAHRLITVGERDRWEVYGRFLLGPEIAAYEEIGFAGYGNFEGPGHPPQFKNITEMRREFGRKYLMKQFSCAQSCPSRCNSLFYYPEVGAMPMTCDQWDTLGCFTKIPSLEANFKWMHLVQGYGMDGMSLSNVLGLAIDLYKRGILTKEDTGIDLEFSDLECVLALTEKIAVREGIGDVLAEGVKVAAEKIGRGAEYYAGQVKGVEFSRYDPRGFKGNALAYVVESSGKIFASQNYYELVAVGIDAAKLAEERFGTRKAAEPHAYESKHLPVIHTEDTVMIADSVGICRWNTPWMIMPITVEVMAPIVSAATGMDLDAQTLWRYADKGKTLSRAIDVRECIDRKDDVLPKRFYEEPIKTMKEHLGEVVDKDKFEKLLDAYYSKRGWDVKTGVPTRKKLEEHGLKDVADELQEIGKLP